MNNWKAIQSSLSNIDFQGSAGKFAKGLSSTVQQTKERLGQVAPDEITELPQGKYTVEKIGYVTQKNYYRVQGFGGQS